MCLKLNFAPTHFTNNSNDDNKNSILNKGLIKLSKIESVSSSKEDEEDMSHKESNKI